MYNNNNNNAAECNLEPHVTKLLLPMTSYWLW